MNSILGEPIFTVKETHFKTDQPTNTGDKTKPLLQKQRGFPQLGTRVCCPLPQPEPRLQSSKLPLLGSSFASYLHGHPLGISFCFLYPCTVSGLGGWPTSPLPRLSTRMTGGSRWFFSHWTSECLAGVTFGDSFMYFILLPTPDPAEVEDSGWLLLQQALGISPGGSSHGQD